jgi:hypothetical protein
VKNITERLFQVLVPSLFAFPLFKESLGTFLFILLTVNTLLYAISSKVFPDRRIWYFTIPFWVILFNCLWFFDDADSMRATKNGMYFLLFPIVFSCIPASFWASQKIARHIDILKYACAVIAVAYIALFFYYYDFKDLFVYKYDIPKFRYFIYDEVPVFRIHPTYFTAMVLFCCAHAFDRVLRKKRYRELALVGIYALITFLSLAKLNIMLLSVLLVGMLLFRSRLTRRQKAGSVIVLALATATMVATVPGIQKRFLEVYNSYNKPPVGLSYDSTNIRVSIYRCCLQIARTDYLTGVGFTNLGQRLSDCYAENYSSDFYKRQGYLSHNYYFYIFLSTGIFGLLLFIFYMVKIYRAALEIDQFALYVGLGVVFLICFTEDYFYRQYGIFFFSLVFFSYYRNRQAKVAEELMASPML